MFLITTADYRYWKPEQKILFLGEWCLIYKDRAKWQNLDYQLLPYHWDDRSKLYKDYRYLTALFSTLLPAVAKCLNTIHGTDHSIRYWNIIIAPWLRFFIESVYDRYLSIYAAARLKTITNTVISTADPESAVPLDFTEFNDSFINDTYNHVVYSRLIEQSGEIPYERAPSEIITPEPRGKELRNRPREVLRWLLDRYDRCIPNALNQVVLISSYLNRKDLFRLQLRLGQAPFFGISSIPTPNLKYQSELRSKFMHIPTTNLFETRLISLISELIPKAYIESYQQLRCAALNQYPNAPKVIFTSNAHYANEGFKIWAAESVEHDAKLIIGQHGGHYGSGLFSSADDFEIGISDQFFSWGWSSKDDVRVRPTIASKLVGINKRIRVKPAGDILWVLTSIPRYSYRLYSIPVASQTLIYLNEQMQFASALNSQTKKSLLLRLYPYDYGWNERERWEDIKPDFRIYRGGDSLEAQLSQSRLFIGTYNATTYLETLSANFPTIIFWNPKYWEIRPEASPYFELLRDVGIFHETPIAAARFVNEITDNPLKWWQTAKVQEARRTFCDIYARTGPDWMGAWKNELVGII